MLGIMQSLKHQSFLHKYSFQQATRILLIISKIPVITLSHEISEFKVNTKSYCTAMISFIHNSYKVELIASMSPFKSHHKTNNLLCYVIHIYFFCWLMRYVLFHTQHHKNVIGTRSHFMTLFLILFTLRTTWHRTQTHTHAGDL